MAIKSCWYRLGGKGVTRCPWCARTAVSMLATPLQPNRPACGAGLRSLEWPAKTNHALIPETSASEPHPIFHFTRTWKCLLFLAHFSGACKSEGVAPKSSDEVAIEAFAKIDVSADISARGSGRTPNIFAAWLINAPTFSI